MSFDFKKLRELASQLSDLADSAEGEEAAEGAPDSGEGEAPKASVMGDLGSMRRKALQVQVGKLARGG